MDDVLAAVARTGCDRNRWRAVPWQKGSAAGAALFRAQRTVGLFGSDEGQGFAPR
jgi:hypothetical protein